MLPPEVFAQAEAAARKCDLFLSIGTSAVVFPAASLPLIALDNGAFVVEINLELTDLSTRAHETLRGKAGEILPALLSYAGIQDQGDA
jgi:NAD-dependent deacetylase